MTTKASPPATATNTNTNTGGVKIKKEIPSDEIKEFAETAMNELLGWYGYDGVDRLDIPTKPTHRLQSTSHIGKIRSRSRNGVIDCKRSQHGGDSTTSDPDTRSSREDSKSPNSSGKTVDEKSDANNCVWCRRPVADNSTDFLTTADGPRYCSESCFTQSRRASFKKAKTCDWCRHVRHAVSYVDFQDGASQLQFCSDKCLNQYKMQIFCKETQAHLDMNPHLRDKGLETASGSGGLITPDLWLRNCRSRSASPTSTISLSPTPTTAVTSSSAIGSKLHKPIISVAPVAKLMSKSSGIMNNRQSPKHGRKKKPSRSGAASAGLVNNTCNKTSGGNLNNCLNNKLSLSSKSKVSSINMNMSSVLPPKPFANVPDLQHINAPSTSPIDGSQPPIVQHPAARPSGFFPSTTYQPPPPFIHQPQPRFYPGMHNLPPIPDVIPGLLGTPPPVTVMVPYPVVIPLPIPIPIPLPIIDFIKAAQKKDNPVASPQPSALKTTEYDEPLDFTKSRDDDEQLTQHESPSPEMSSDDQGRTSKHRLPKFKITRVQSKRNIPVPSTSPSVTPPASRETQGSISSECSRPLRKRKRLIDCDFQRMASKDQDSEEAETPIGSKPRK